MNSRLLAVQKLQWAIYRLVFMIAAFGGIVSASLLGYILAPLTSWCFFNDFNIFKYHRRFIPLVACFWKMFFEWVRNPEYRRISAISLTAPPLNGPDLSGVRVRMEWPDKDGSCNGCIKCCIIRACPLVDLEHKHCMSYGSFYWRYFNCGRYPETSRQIRYYNCPKWEVY